MSEPFNDVFIRNMRAQLGSDADAFFCALGGQHLRGLRLNPRKPADIPDELGLMEPIPWWAEYGRYLAANSAAGVSPLHEAGAYYIQEPSAMAPVSVLAPRAGERVLDLCAAPGGKSTQIADAMHGDGLLVCNEPVPARAKSLSRSVERMGVTNALVVSAEPEALLQRWKNTFDAVLVDAPCSGEGMFRRHPETRAEWSADSPEGCAARQKRILACAVKMLKTGGRLVYSTCTFNRAENDEVAKWLANACPYMELTRFALQAAENSALSAPSGTLHLYPHQLNGEGHFIALFTKTGSTDGDTSFAPASTRLGGVPKPALEAYRGFAEPFAAYLPAPNASLGDALITAPDLPPLDGIKLLRAGLRIGEARGKLFVPDHALAMGLASPLAPECPSLPLTLSEAKAYLGGEALPTPSSLRGWALATYRKLPLGFVKLSDGAAKNHYPKGLRKLL